MLHFVVNSLVTTVSLLVLTKLPLGIENKGIKPVSFAAFLVDSRNTLFRPVFTYLAASYQWIILGLLSIGLSSLIFWITPNLLDGFHVRTGVMSAFINPVALSVLKPLLLWFLP